MLSFGPSSKSQWAHQLLSVSTVFSDLHLTTENKVRDSKRIYLSKMSFRKGTKQLIFIQINTFLNLCHLDFV